MTTLDFQQNSLGAASGFYSASTNNDGWTYKYLLPAGTYTIEEISDSGAKVDGKPFVTGSTAYELNGVEIAKGTQIEVKAGESHSVVVYNTYLYQVTFNANGGIGTMDKQTFTNNKPQGLFSNQFTRDGYTFAGWNTQADGSGDSYTDGQSFTPDNSPGLTLYAQWTQNTAPGDTTSPTAPSGYSGPSLWYIGGNTFGTSTTKAPTKVEIDGAAVPFTMDGSKIIVSCINADADWVTARWGSTTNTVNFTPDAAAYCTQVSIPKTGDMPLWAAIAAFLGF